jgi:eukaryotic-like serine/threonine-protein kinase
MGEKVAKGDVLAGKYRVERVLGSGGMGVVVAARHIQLEVLVALKFMTEQAGRDPDLVARFLREARAAARLRGEHVARVSDVGTLESGAPYQVIEYLEGSDLDAVLVKQGRLPVDVAVAYAIQTCEALEEAHRAGIVHRDIKPSNLFLTTRPNGTPCIKVLDFGISKLTGLGVSTSNKLRGTRGRVVLGSPSYMAPEQMHAAHSVDRRVDLWSVGATLYELLTGHVPFEAESLLELALRIAQSHPRPIRATRAEVAPALEAIVLRCLEKDRERRFGSAQLLAEALAPFAPPAESRSSSVQSIAASTTSRPVTSTLAMGVSAPTSEGQAAAVAPNTSRGSPTDARVSWGSQGQRPRARSHLAMGVAAVALVTVVGGVVLVAHPQAMSRGMSPAANPAGFEVGVVPGANPQGRPVVQDPPVHLEEIATAASPGPSMPVPVSEPPSAAGRAAPTSLAPPPALEPRTTAKRVSAFPAAKPPSIAAPSSLPAPAPTRPPSPRAAPASAPGSSPVRATDPLANPN